MVRRADKLLAEKHGIPKWLRSHAVRHGQSVTDIVQIQLQNGEGKRVGDRRDKLSASEQVIS